MAVEMVSVGGQTSSKFEIQIPPVNLSLPDDYLKHFRLHSNEMREFNDNFKKLLDSTDLMNVSINDILKKMIENAQNTPLPVIKFDFSELVKAVKEKDVTTRVEITEKKSGLYIFLAILFVVQSIIIFLTLKYSR